MLSIKICLHFSNFCLQAKCGFPQSASVHAKAISSVEGFTFDINMRYLWPTGQSAPTTFAVDQLGDWEVGFFGTPNGTVLKVKVSLSVVCLSVYLFYRLLIQNLERL